MKASKSSGKARVAVVGVAPKKTKLSEEAGPSVVRPRTPMNNVVRVARNAEIHGRGPRHVSQLPKPFLLAYQKEHSNDLDTMPEIILELFQLSRKGKIDLTDKGLNSRLEVIDDLMMNDSKAKSASLNFHCMGGNEVMADILTQSFYDMSDDIYKHTEPVKIPSAVLPTAKTIIQIMFQSTQMSSIRINHLSTNPHLMHLLFSLFAEKDRKIYIDATMLLEEIIMSAPRHSIFDMKKVACLENILTQNLSYEQNAHLYHVFASAVSAGDSLPMIEITLQEHDSWLLNNPKTRINKENQDYLISLEPFLTKLFVITCHEIAYDSSIINDVIRRLFQQHPELESRFTSDMWDRLNSGILGNNTDNPFFKATVCHEKSVKADAFLLMSLLLTGKNREQMQESVLKYDLIRRLEKTVDTVVWSNFGADNCPHRHQHGENNDDDHIDCGPESTVKIQYFRLIYSISDHHVHRYLLLSKKELEEVEEISESYGVPVHKDFKGLNSDKHCVQHPGLLTQVVEKMKSESGTSYIRFWMTRALESFLRGATSVVDQIFLLNRNLVEELFSVLLSQEVCSSEVIQGNFDLLASLMKNNAHAFRRFASVVDCLDTFQKLCRTINYNLVDSNMFVRCIVLTLHHFATEERDQADLVEHSRILRYYTDFGIRIASVTKLINLLTVKTLSQENVSCLNTSILVFLIARTNGQVPMYLSAILRHEEEFCKPGKDILENLTELLQFWLEHYTLPFKESDVKSLEESTGFAFAEWKILVSELISRDVTSPSSILHHLTSTAPAHLLPTAVAPPCTRTN